MSIILASKSASRSAILANAGVAFSAVSADIDERAIEDTLAGTGATPADVATVLAEAKALAVSETDREAFVIGADQTLSLDDEILHKAQSMEAARRRLLHLSGHTHQLNSAIVIARNKETVWRHVSVAHMTMRDLSPEFVGRHLGQTGKKVLASVGCYQIEGEGIQLFKAINGDYFTIIGLPLLPLLDQLRRLEAIDG